MQNICKIRDYIIHCNTPFKFIRVTHADTNFTIYYEYEKKEYSETFNIIDDEQKIKYCSLSCYESYINVGIYYIPSSNAKPEFIEVTFDDILESNHKHSKLFRLSSETSNN